MHVSRAFYTSFFLHIEWVKFRGDPISDNKLRVAPGAARGRGVEGGVMDQGEKQADTLVTFRAGSFDELDAVPYIGEAVEDFDDRLKAAGFGLSQTVGDASGIHYELWEHTERHEWIIVFGTAGYWCPILCQRWADLIELLAKLSPVALAGMIQEADSGDPFITVRLTRAARG
jgi:hypothetical protein